MLNKFPGRLGIIVFFCFTNISCVRAIYMGQSIKDSDLSDMGVTDASSITDAGAADLSYVLQDGPPAAVGPDSRVDNGVAYQDLGQPTLSWISLVSNARHTCGIRSDNTLWCWGSNVESSLSFIKLPKQIGSDNDWIMVAPGNTATCALKANKTIWCWGDNFHGQLGDGTTTSKYSLTQVGTDADWEFLSTGFEHTCAIKTDKTLWCWGWNYGGQLGRGSTSPMISPTPAKVGTAANWLTVAGGENHTCAIKTDNTLWCWGQNYYGQIGNGTSGVGNNVLTPSQVGATTDWKSVAAYFDHTCAIKTDNTLWCWGNNERGEIGDGTSGAAAYKNTPTQIDASATWKSVRLTYDHTCAIKMDNTIWCWGGNDNAQLGDGSCDEKHVPTILNNDIDWQLLTLEIYRTCALKNDNSLWCWGKELADYTTSGLNRSLPYAVNNSFSANEIASGEEIVCAIKSDHSLWCWGATGLGQSGNSAYYYKAIPVRINSDNDWKTITISKGYTGAASPGHACALKIDNSLWCWGKNNYGQVGDGSVTAKTSPVRIGSGNDWRVVAAGDYHTCAIKTDNSLWCWGTNDYGQLGDNTSGTSAYKTGPTRIGSDFNWQVIAPGGWHTCGIKTDNTLWCWGQNIYGQLGINTSGAATNKLTPYQIDTNTDWQELTAGEQHNCAMKTDGTIWCWGQNQYSRIGIGSSPAHVLVPTKVFSTGGWLAFQGAYGHSCAIKSDSTLWCWGYNQSNQVGGQYAGSQIAPPIQIGTDTDWKSLGLGTNHSCATKINGSVYCWGSGNFGHLGTALARPTKIM